MNKFYKFYKKHDRLFISLLAILIGFIIGAIIMLITKINPIEGYQALFKGIFKTKRRIAELFVYAMPIILSGFAIGFAFKTGLFNIGAEGQVIIGSMCAVVVGILFPMPRIIHLPLTILAGAAGGAIWAFIPGIIKAKFNIHEVVISIMLNYTALYFANYIYRQLPLAMSIQTVDIAESATLKSEWLSSITENSRLNWGIIIVILALFIYWFILNKTTFGYELKAVGHNQSAAKYAGMKVKRNIVLSMMISGAFAGLAGVVVATGIFNYGRVINSMENYGFNGIAVALVGGNSAIGILFSGILFGGLKLGADGMKVASIPSQIADIVVASIVMLIAMQQGLKNIFEKILKNERRSKK